MWARKSINDQDFQSIVRDARDYALQNGLVLRYPHLESANSVAQIPVALLPSSFPRKFYQECLDLQPIVSNLMLKVANSHEFMEQSLEGVSSVDEFTRNLLNINSIVRSEGQAQSIISCINRSDYMLDVSERQQFRLRQVEVNAIACGMSAHSFNTRKMHEYLVRKYRLMPNYSDLSPANEALNMIALGLVDAYNCYGKTDCYILLVAESLSKNFSDYLSIELAVHKMRPDVRVIRKSFASLPESARIGPNKELFVNAEKEIAVVYFRDGYDPSNYNFEGAWDTRLLLERSRAIKCPSINFHISGIKKFQQLLNNQEQLEKFLCPSDAEKLSKVFCKFWSLDAGNKIGEEAYQMGINSPDGLVLKPQREGGGHNIFGQDIKPFLQQIIEPKERSQYILMEYINSPVERNWLLFHDDEGVKDQTRLSTYDKLVSELGIYGSIIADGDSIKHNRSAGYLVRTKKLGVKEGGVAAGYAGLGSLILLDFDYSKEDISLFYDL